jgi:hypothetical protein
MPRSIKSDEKGSLGGACCSSKQPRFPRVLVHQPFPGRARDAPRVAAVRLREAGDGASAGRRCGSRWRLALPPWRAKANRHQPCMITVARSARHVRNVFFTQGEGVGTYKYGNVKG